MNFYFPNPVWTALNSHQSYLNMGDEQLKYFPADICPFVGLENWDENDLEILINRLPSDRTFSMPLSKTIVLPDQFKEVFAIPLYQMICNHFQPFENHSITLLPLSEKHVPQMLQLTERTKPGPFYERTIEFGNYYGIFQEDKLISMAGQRLQTNTHTEVSAICTNPQHLGKSYAKALTSHICSIIIDNGKIPFLHVRQDNAGAIALYKKLGFEIATEIAFAVFKKK